MRVVNIQSGETGTYVGRPSPLGNPYKIGEDGTREEVIDKYRYYLHHRIMTNNKRILDALRELQDDSVLVCHCAPLACHAEVIAKAWQWAKDTHII